MTLLRPRLCSLSPPYCLPCVLPRSALFCIPQRNDCFSCPTCSESPQWLSRLPSYNPMTKPGTEQIQSLILTPSLTTPTSSAGPLAFLQFSLNPRGTVRGVGQSLGTDQRPGKEKSAWMRECMDAGGQGIQAGGLRDCRYQRRGEEATARHHSVVWS